MPQPTLNQVHINRPMANISVAYVQEDSEFVFHQVFPIVPVDKKSDLYFIYDKSSFLRDEAQVRAPGTESAGGGYPLSTASYDCTVYAWHDDVPQQIIENSDVPLAPIADSTIVATQKLMLRQENIWAANYFTTGVWATSATLGSGFAYQWSDQSSSSPVEDVTVGIETIKSSTGKMPNILTLGWRVWAALKNHPDIIDRIKYGASNGNPAVVTQQALAAIFGVQKVIVAGAVQATANENNPTQTYDFILGKNALLSYAPDGPSIRKPSAGYSFYWRGISGGAGLPVKITDFYLQWLEATRVEAEVAVAMAAVSTDCGYFFSGVVA